MTENEPNSDSGGDSDSIANNPPLLPGSSIYGKMPPPPGDEPDPFAAPSPYQVSPAVADPAASYGGNEDENILTLASPGLRLAAAILDGALMLVPFTIINLLIDGPEFLEENSEPSSLAVLLGGGYMLAFFVTHITLLCTRGQSLGKLLVGIQIVVHRTGEKAGFVNALLLRGFVGGLPAAIPCLGWIYYIVDCCFIFQAGHRTLHDLIGGTSVIKVTKVPSAANMAA